MSLRADPASTASKPVALAHHTGTASGDAPRNSSAAIRLALQHLRLLHFDRAPGRREPRLREFLRYVLRPRPAQAVYSATAAGQRCAMTDPAEGRASRFADPYTQEQRERIRRALLRPVSSHPAAAATPSASRGWTVPASETLEVRHSTPARGRAIFALLQETPADCAGNPAADRIRREKRCFALRPRCSLPPHTGR